MPNQRMNRAIANQLRQAQLDFRNELMGGLHELNAKVEFLSHVFFGMGYVP